MCGFVGILTRPGRPVDADLHKRVAELLASGLGIRATARHANCSTTTVLKIKEKKLKNSYTRKLYLLMSPQK